MIALLLLGAAFGLFWMGARDDEMVARAIFGGLGAVMGVLAVLTAIYEA